LGLDGGIHFGGHESGAEVLGILIVVEGAEMANIEPNMFIYHAQMSSGSGRLRVDGIEFSDSFYLNRSTSRCGGNEADVR
jgi:hypothetical protein